MNTSNCEFQFWLLDTATECDYMKSLIEELNDELKKLVIYLFHIVYLLLILIDLIYNKANMTSDRTNK